MARGRIPRTWIKIDCNGILRGSVNYILTLEQQAIWVKLLAYSEVCGGEAGFIQDNNGGALPRSFLSQELHCSEESLNLTIIKMTEDKAINSNGTGVIEIVNYKTYQFGEYDRQKPYREAKKLNKTDKDITDDKVPLKEYIETVLTKDFPDIDIPEELKKFNIYWSEGKRTLQRPKTAFRNWLVNARKYKQENNSGAHRGSISKQVSPDAYRAAHQ